MMMKLKDLMKKIVVANPAMKRLPSPKQILEISSNKIRILKRNLKILQQGRKQKALSPQGKIKRSVNTQLSEWQLTKSLYLAQ